MFIVGLVLLLVGLVVGVFVHRTVGLVVTVVGVVLLVAGLAVTDASASALAAMTTKG